MKLFLLVTLAICAVSAQSSDDDDKIFYDYLEQYNIRLPRSNGELEIRKKNFFAHKDEVEKHNDRYRNGQESYELAINEFSIYSHDEFLQFKTGSLPTNGTGGEPAPDQRRGRITPPASWDWRSTAGVVRPVQNQGSCGSCWAFAAIGSIEGQMSIKKGRNDKLSEQEVIECARNPWTGQLLGCNGGWDFAVYNFANQYNGVTTTSYKPYRAVDYLGCNTGNPRASGSKVSAYYNIQAGNENAMKDALVNTGPLYVAFYVSNDFFSYRSGVYTDAYGYCRSQPYANHAVLLVGYGNQNGVDYWLLKNSWGTGWGESGYFKLQRGRNLCLIANTVSYPKLA